MIRGLASSFSNLVLPGAASARVAKPTSDEVTAELYSRTKGYHHHDHRPLAAIELLSLYTNLTVAPLGISISEYQLLPSVSDSGRPRHLPVRNAHEELAHSLQ